MRKLLLIVAVALALLTLLPVVYGRDDTPRPDRDDTPRADRDRRVVIFRSGGPRLGVEIDDITAERAKALGLKEESGVEIEEVLPDSPAAEAGLKKGDVIQTYQGTRVESAMQLTRLVRETPAGRTVTLQVHRDGSTRNVSIKLAEREEGDYDVLRRHHIEIPPIEIPDIPDIPDISHFGHLPGRVRLGAQVESLTGQLGEYFGVKDGRGVLVQSVSKGGPGDTAGLKAGDVIIRVDDERVDDQAELRAALRERRGKELKLGIVRDRREMTLTIPAPKDDEEGGEPAHFQWFERHPDSEEIEEDIETAFRSGKIGAEVASALREAYETVQKEMKSIDKDSRTLAVEMRDLADEMVKSGEAMRQRGYAEALRLAIEESGAI